MEPRRNFLQESLDRASSSMRGAERAKLLFTIDEASVTLGVSRAEVERLINSGDLTAGTLGPRRLIHRDQLESFARSLAKVFS